jgi:hypothetical protein
MHRVHGSLFCYTSPNDRHGPEDKLEGNPWYAM